MRYTCIDKKSFKLSVLLSSSHYNVLKKAPRHEFPFIPLRLANAIYTFLIDKMSFRLSVLISSSHYNVFKKAPRHEFPFITRRLANAIYTF